MHAIDIVAARPATLKLIKIFRQKKIRYKRTYFCWMKSEELIDTGLGLGVTDNFRVFPKHTLRGNKYNEKNVIHDAFTYQELWDIASTMHLNQNAIMHRGTKNLADGLATWMIEQCKQKN